VSRTFNLLWTFLIVETFYLVDLHMRFLINIIEQIVNFNWRNVLVYSTKCYFCLFEENYTNANNSQNYDSRKIQ